MLLVFNMAMLKYVKVAPRKSCSPSILSQKDIEAAQKSIANAVSVAAEKSQSCGKYNSLVMGDISILYRISVRFSNIENIDIFCFNLIFRYDMLT